MSKVVIGIVFYAVFALIVFAIGVEIIHIRSKKVRPFTGVAMIILALLILCAITAPYLIIYRGVYAFSNLAVGEYDGFANKSPYWDDARWEIGANRYEEPVFRHPQKAFAIARQEYADVLELLEDQYHLGSFSKLSIEEYEKNIWHVSVKNSEIDEQRMRLAEFMDIYDNSIKRWHYLPAEGWERN